MAKAVRRQLGRAWLPAEADAAAELSVPHPQVNSRQAGDDRAVGECDGRPLGVLVRLLGHEAVRICVDVQQLLRRSFRSEVVRGPGAEEGRLVGGEVGQGGTDEVHGGVTPRARLGSAHQRDESLGIGRPFVKSSLRYIST